MIIAVNNKKLLKDFIDFPHDLYRDDAAYVPELFIAQRDLLTPGKHPFHEHGEMQLFLAVEGEKIKGRIAAIWNKNYNRFAAAQDGFFGFFDAENNQEIANQLLDKAIEWLKAKGAVSVIGPVNPSTNEPCALLIDGFEYSPSVMMVYNKPYYKTLLEQYGFEKKFDTLAYAIPVKTADRRSIALQDALLKRLQAKGITIRPVNMKDFRAEADRIKTVYNAAWDKNLGFVPMTDNEFKYLAKDLKMILDPKFCLVAEHNNQFVGFALAIPNLNQALKKVKRGRLLPTGVFTILMELKKIESVRVLALGVLEPYRKMGIEACFYAAIIKRAEERKMLFGEASWILEDNEMMNKGIQSLNGQVTKRYRIFEKSI